MQDDSSRPQAHADPNLALLMNWVEQHGGGADNRPPEPPSGLAEPDVHQLMRIDWALSTPLTEIQVLKVDAYGEGRLQPMFMDSPEPTDGFTTQFVTDPPLTKMKVEIDSDMPTRLKGLKPFSINSAENGTPITIDRFVREVNEYARTNLQDICQGEHERDKLWFYGRGSSARKDDESDETIVEVYFENDETRDSRERHWREMAEELVRRGMA